MLYAMEVLIGCCLPSQQTRRVHLCIVEDLRVDREIIVPLTFNLSKHSLTVRGVLQYDKTKRRNMIFQLILHLLCVYHFRFPLLSRLWVTFARFPFLKVIEYEKLFCLMQVKDLS